LVFPKPLWDGLVLTVGIVYALGIVAFNRFGFDYYSLTKVFRKTVHQQAVYWRWGKLRFSFFNTLCTIRHTARPSCKTLLSMKKCTKNKTSIDSHYSASCSGSTRKDQNLESSQTVKPYWKFQTKAIKSRFKITSHENCVALSNHFYQSLIKNESSC
jgi:hypothetical protein